MYRKQDLNYLNNMYERVSNDIVVVYGKSRSGIKDLINDFINDKIFFYYKALSVTVDMQHSFLEQSLNSQMNIPKYEQNNLTASFKSFLNDNPSSKKVIIIDDFEELIESNIYNVDYIINYLSDESIKSRFIFVLISHDEYWIEQEMISVLGKKIYEFSGVLHIQDLSMNECFINYAGIKNDYDLFSLYTCIGGNGLFWNKVKSDTTLKSFIIDYILNDESMVHFSGINILPKTLRQQAVYNTILHYIAHGYNKLNDLSIASNIGKSKLSVYIKAMLSYGLIYKCEGIEIGLPSNILKGTYKIADSFVHFWYRFVFHNLSSLPFMSADRFYRKYIESYLFDYMKEYYTDYCISKLEGGLVSSYYDFLIKDVSKYYDKAGCIDFVITTADDEYVICSSIMDSHYISARDYDKIASVINKNNIKSKGIILFSSAGFDQKLSMKGSVDKNIILIDEKQHWIR